MLAVLLTALPAPSVHAQTFEVTSLNDDGALGTLRQVILNAHSNNLVTFHLERTGTIMFAARTFAVPDIPSTRTEYFPAMTGVSRGNRRILVGDAAALMRRGLQGRIARYVRPN